MVGTSPPGTPEALARITEHRPEIATLDFWESMKPRNRAGDIPDLSPYPASVRLHHQYTDHQS